MLSRIVLLCVVSALLAAGCGGDEGRESTVVAAFYPLAYAAEQVGARDVADLTPPGAEPHDLELTARDVERIRGASLVVYVGGGFQPALEDALESRRGPTLDVLDGLAVGRDPHVWLDPLRYASVARRVASAVGDPAGAEPLVARLRALDRDYRRGLGDCRRRELVTSHAAFGYLARRYGLRELALTGVSPEAEPDARQLADLVDAVRRAGATTVFVEKLVPRDLAETVAREAGATTAVLDPLEGLTESELDAGADYVSVMRDNLAALRAALGCR